MSEPAARGPVRASLVIATCDRVPELRALLESLRRQTVPLEVLVMDDAQSDATRDMIAADFPEARYHRLGTRRGPTFQRNRGIELASSDIVFPIDDDTTLASPRTVEQTLAEFDDPAIAAVGIPFINVRQDDTVWQRAPGAGTAFVGDAFVGAAHALRRDVFLELGGYREHFFYMGEEADFCLRAMDRGFLVRLGNADPIHHHESPRRDPRLADYYAPRNLVLFAWHNVPARYLFAHLAASMVRASLWSLKPDRFVRRVGALKDGVGMVVKGRVQRTPVRTEAYRLMRRLKRGGPRPLAEALEDLHARGA